MSNKYNKIIKIELPIRKIRLARLKGRKFANISISLTEEQIHWLATKPNASEIMRKLLDDLIAAGKDVQPKLEVISLNNQIKELKKQCDELYKQKMDYIDANKNLWKMKEDPGYEPKIDFDMTEDFVLWTPKPSDTEYAVQKSVKYGMRIVKGYNDGIRAIRQKIAENEGKVLQDE